MKRISLNILKSAIVAFCLCFKLSISTFAQTTTVHAQQFCINNGLSHNTVNAIVEDSYGFIWIATPNGLNRYDGYTIKQYFHSLSDSNSIPDNFINSLYVDKKGELLIFGRNGGITQYNYRTDKFKSQPLAIKCDTYTLKKNNVRQMIEDKFGIKWISTDFGIGKEQNHSWRWFQKIGTIDLTQQNIRLLGLNLKQDVLVSPSLDGGIYYYESKNNSFVPIPETPNLFNNTNKAVISYTKSDKNNIQWFATDFDGIYKQQQYSITEHYSNDISKYGLTSSNITATIYDNSQTLWLGMRTAGLAYFNATENIFYSCNIQCSEKSFQQFTVKALCKDAVHNLWVGTENQGVFCVGYRSNLFKTYSTFPLDIGGYGNSNISCIYEHSDKSIWLGTFNNEIYRFDTDKAISERFTIPAPAMIADFCSNNDGKFWVATWGNGVYLFDPIRGNVSNGIERKVLQNYSHCKAIIKSKNYIWIATHGHGIVLYDCLANKVYDEENPIQFLKQYTDKFRYVNDLAISKTGTIWIATNNTIYEFDGQQLVEHPVSNITKQRKNEAISTLFIDKKDNVWIAGENILNCYDSKTKKVEQYHAKHKSLPKHIKAITEDESGGIWLTGESELINFNPRNSSVRVFDASEGMSLQQFNERAAIHTSNNWIAIGSATGMALFRPESVVPNTIVPKVLIQSCYILDTTNGAVQGGLLPTKDILSDQRNDTIELSYSSSRFIGFDFVGINLMSSPKIQYAYQLEGFDSYWHYAGTERKASYTNIPPGHYLFMVKAANCDGKWSEKPTSIHIYIQTPWWQETWFIILSIFLFIASIIGFVSYRTSKIRQTNKRLEEQVKLRTQQLNEKTLFIEAQNNDLIDKNSKIEEQNHELSTISDQLQRNNVELQYKNEELESMTEELRVQSEALQSTNETLNQTLATKDKLFSVIAHDLKNPFSGIISFIDLLQNDYNQFDDEKRQYFIGMIAKSSQTVFDLLTNLFNWARSQTGIMDAKPSSFDILEVFELVKEQQMHLAEAKSISITITQEPAVVYADKSMIETVIRNLVHNAIKFTRPGGTIYVSAKIVGNNVVMQIQDSGVGIAPERLIHMFKPNQIQSSHGTDSEKGSGLGLLICKEFIELNHGFIKLESIVEQGSICTIQLPSGSLDKIENKPTEYKSRFESMLQLREKAASKTRLLIVDDSTEIRLSMVEHLEYYFTVKQAVDGNQAWQILQNESFDLVVSDIMMVGIDGFELCNRIRKNKQFESMGVILITANTEEKNQIIGLNIGADAYLEKPFSMALLLSQVNAVLQRKRPVNQLLQIPTSNDSSAAENTIEKETIEKINGILEANYPKADFGIEQLADIMCMSRSQLYRKMRLWYGVTPIEYLQRYRLQKSTELLKTGKYRMVDVASLAGFSCQQYFTTVFTKHFAISPSEYMRMHRKNASEQ